MKKLKKEELEKIKKKLKPFWEEYWEIYMKFRKQEEKLENKMTEEIGLKIPLEFFYVDGECVGIGAEDFSDRKRFPLIDESELNPCIK